MKQIELSKGLYTLVDPEDYALLNQTKWSAYFKPHCNKWYAQNKKEGLLHRYLLGIKDPNVLVYHKNGNTLDNTRQNLEVISREISKRRAKKKTSTNIYRGVTKMSKNKWRADIKNNFIGSFDTPEEAAKAWNKFALEFYGNDAQLNEI